MAKILFDKSLNVDVPTLLLKRRDFLTIGIITNASELIYKAHYNSANELSFKIYKDSNNTGVSNEVWEKLTSEYLVCIPEYKEYFEMQVSLNEDENGAVYKTVTCTALAESELSNTKLYDIEINTDDDIARPEYDENFPTILYRNPDKYENYNWTDKKYIDYTVSDKKETLRKSSLLHILLEKTPHYRIGYIDSSLEKLSDFYQFRISDKNVYSVLTGDVAKNYQCRFVFDSENRIINVYDLCNTCKDCGYRGDFHNKCPACGSTNFSGAEGNDTTIFISKDNLTASIESNKDSLKNCLRVIGGDDVITSAVEMSNPNGSKYLYYFSPETLESMPNELVDKIKSYNKIYDEYLNKHVYSFNQSLADNYNRVIDYIKNYYPQTEYTEIPTTVTGYKNITPMIYNAIDLALYVQSGMMKTPEVENQGIDDAIQLLNSTTLGEIAVSSPSDAVKSIVQNAILGVCKLYVNTALYKISIEAGDKYTPDSKNDSGTWTGKFKLTSIEDKTVTKVSPRDITLAITDNEEVFLKQKMEKVLSQSDNTYKPLQSRIFDDTFNENDFKDELHYYSINYLQNLYDMFEDCLSIILDSKNGELQEKYKGFYTKYRDSISKEITLRTTQLDSIKIFYSYGTEENSYQASGILSDIKNQTQALLNLESYLGEDFWKIFCSYRREDSYKNDTYISDGLDNAGVVKRASQLLEAAKKELYKLGNMQYNVTASLNNLLALKEFQPIVNDFECGNWIHLKVDEQVYDLRLLSYQITFDNLSQIDVEFSTVENIWSGISDVESVLNSAASIAGGYSNTTQQIKNNTEYSQYVDGWVKKGFSATANKIVNNADNVGVTIDRTGITCARYDDIEDQLDPWQTKLIDTGLYVTSDNWNTVQAAIGKYVYVDPSSNTEKTVMGVLADMIVGRFILGEQLGIYNASGSMSFDKNGLSINNRFKVDMNGNVTLPLGTSISWSDIVNKGSISELNNDLGFIDSDTATKITKNTVDAQFIRSLKLTVGKEIQMGENATISWSKVTDNENVATKDDIPNDAYITNISKNAITTEFLNAKGITAKDFSATTIIGKNINGGSIDIGSGNFVVDAKGNLTTKGNLNISDKLTYSPSAGLCVNGTIQSTNGMIGGFTINKNSIYNNTNSMTSEKNGIYIGTDGIRSISSKAYVNISEGSVITKGLMYGAYGKLPSAYIGGYLSCYVDNDDGCKWGCIDIDNSGITAFKDSNVAWFFLDNDEKNISIGNLIIYDFNYSNPNNTGKYDTMLESSHYICLSSTIGNNTKRIVFGSAFRPFVSSDNEINLGNGTDGRWHNIYATNTTISTSDKTQKKDIHYMEEDCNKILEDIFMEIKPCSFMFNNGDRTHWGIIAQDYEDTLNKYGLTANEIGSLCKDIKYTYEKDANGKIIESSATPILDSNGNSVYNYGIRYTELLSPTIHMTQKAHIMIRGLANKNRELESRIETLELKIQQLLEKAVK